ncbi:DUF6143 family protein [Inediibacterium massiliense]|uniref:DUF6143 family protein n=1 Tax=Inediibacterium massiliense TaxID=1658111 RepID=UPI000B17F65D|nr:DUF6143 family protein [Inediibacterium massiliense]
MDYHPNINYQGQYSNSSNCISCSSINCHNQHCGCYHSKPSIFTPSLQYTVDVPINLAKSLEGKYFVGYADNLTFGMGTSAWARLYNPPNSGVNLHLAVWTVSDVVDSSFRAQIWFNASAPGVPQKSTLITPANTALCPLPQPRIELQYAVNVTGEPTGGIKAFVRRAQPESTLVDDEQGKFIFPPCGSFLIFLSNPESPDLSSSGRIAFGWWEEPLKI